MKALIKLFLLLLAATGLASCGGGGGGSQSAFTPTPADTITISAASTSITTNSFTTLTITVKKADGSVENDGTSVNASLSPSTIGTVSGASGSSGTTASNTLTGGKTTFNFASSNQTGTATITISLPSGTNGSPTTATASTAISVTQGNGQDPRLELSATTTTLPVNPYTYGQQQADPFPGNFPGSPYISEVTVTWRHANGQLVTGTTPVNVSVTPTTVIAFSTLNTGTGDQFHTLLGSGPVDVTGGVGTIFIHSSPTPGTATLNVTAIDPDSGQTITSQLQFTVAGAAQGIAASVSLNGGAAYVSGSGGPQSALLSALVTDGSNALVADPGDFDNVQFSIVGPANSDARLSAVNAAGQTVTGTTVSTVTHNGVASVTFLAGNQQGPVQVKATADRGDNNVDNGIQDPVSATATVVVSDGKLYSLTLSSPVVNALLVNGVSSATSATGTIPTDPNATYSLTVSATGVDRQGNPVLPGTVIKFGSIDAPQANGVFQISGLQGNPQEGGKTFAALDGQFRTAGGGAGPGDTLVVFGKQEHGAPAGNADLESAAQVAVVNSQTTLTVAVPFNRNDTTGTSVDNGYVLPYIVGRAQTGNISSPASTNQLGTATTTLNYPVSVLGRPLVLWAQGTGTDTVTNQTKLVTDAEVALFPGLAPATITVSPNPIPGNLTIPVDVCIFDAAQIPISNIFFTFAFDGLGIGSGSVDGISTSGVVPEGTGADGCVTTSVTTNGLGKDTTATLTFSAGDAMKQVPISVSGDLILLAKPSSLPGTGGKVTLQLLTSNGAPVPGVQLVGTCSGDESIGISSPPGVTNSNGETTTVITASLNQIGSAGSGSCTFTTATGSPSAVVTLKGVDLCTLGTSPPPQGCTSTGASFR